MWLCHSHWKSLLFVMYCVRVAICALTEGYKLLREHAIIISNNPNNPKQLGYPIWNTQVLVMDQAAVLLGKYHQSAASDQSVRGESFPAEAGIFG